MALSYQPFDAVHRADLSLEDAADLVRNEKYPRRPTVFVFRHVRGACLLSAAQTLAGKLGRPLHRLHASMLVGKHAGEAERRVQQVLDVAALSGAVLLIDEDAPSDGRTGVTGSDDHRSNLDTAYLLQRLETYSGIAVLSSNRSLHPPLGWERIRRVSVEWPPRRR